jgi:predicted protein tyrosine phosphatase
MGTYILNKDKVAVFKLDKSLYNVLIRITSPGVELNKLKDKHIYRDILELQFFDFPDDSSRLYIFNENILKKVLNFFEKHKNCHNMVIHCEKGISRSAGVAVGWFLFNDNNHSIYKLYHDDKHLPNRLIVEHFYKKLNKDIKRIDRWEKERFERLTGKKYNT